MELSVSPAPVIESFFDLEVVVDVSREKGVEVGNHKDGRFGVVGAMDHADGVAVSVGGALVHLKFGQSIQKGLRSVLFFERGGRDLPNQDDVGEDGFLNCLDLFDVGRKFVKVSVHYNPRLKTILEPGMRSTLLWDLGFTDG